MSTRPELWRLLWEVGTARRLARGCIGGEGPIWQSIFNRYTWVKFSENEKRAIRDYMNDLEMIVWVIFRRFRSSRNGCRESDAVLWV